MSQLYKAAGVDVEAGYEAVERIKKHILRTSRPEVLGEVGAFAGLFELTSFRYKEPILVSGTDGVGTKLKLAIALDKHDTVGIDLVAMCVNDIVAQGAQALFFLDYIACGKNEPTRIEQIVSGIADGCALAGAALIGGETAEMPGMYQDDEYDLAGFVVGIAEKSKIVTGKSIQPGDVVIGLASSGIHSNGYSLVRKLVHGMDYHQVPDGLSKPLGEWLMEPTRIYAQSVKRLQDEILVKGISHITGGGFYENIPRMLPDELGVEVFFDSWETPEIFLFLQEIGQLSLDEMFGIFNMGIGMAIVVSSEEAQTAIDLLVENGEKATVIGRVGTEKGVHIRYE
ncbi:phosphoribosylformylglycinamidine cyclo-ligase [Ornithinibacillus bavariensis]|uniref:Phosphoribosylformylglycinamidine cyclo-ligase n=1 Tax=Ornithinibacillus bavariensis TaxID=545502 RepID=A0A920C8A8_9BACI|nr:phosphoribosylformylglycinamidine cyclo-ligase [Ornithinibacillus bavariensis]GIO28014.1 phosphoribosylformylglycinamidine cyclo-ligase [Ornithinibacillus bavariensis]